MSEGEGELMGKGGACNGESVEEEDIGVEECVSCLQTSLASQGLSPFLQRSSLLPISLSFPFPAPSLSPLLFTFFPYFYFL